MHTKGEWKAEEMGWMDELFYMAVECGDESVAIRVDSDSEDKSRANAHLIAASPMLYEALKHICDRLYGVAGNETEVSSKLYGLLKSLYTEGYDAMAKAGGG